jgi:catechol 2,3-dioxygenase-like lactoylglutathione lyase family enzyme
MTPTFDAIGLVVADMGRALAFYRRLGMSFPDSADREPHVEKEVGAGVRLLIDTQDTIRSFDPGFTPHPGGTLGFRCADPAEVDRTHADLIGAGYRSHKEPWDAPWGQRYAIVLDPDGTAVDLYAPLPGTAS